MGLSSHQRTVGLSQTHLTPRWLLDALGRFDLDPCAAPHPRPWPTAVRHIVEAEDGLSQPWHGRVWLNPPFDSRVAGRWLGRLRDHGNGIALVHARTEATWFRPAWSSHGMLFLARRVRFCGVDGVEQEGNSGAPVVLVAFGRDNLRALERSGLDGVLVKTWRRQGALAAGDMFTPLPRHPAPGPGDEPRLDLGAILGIPAEPESEPEPVREKPSIGALVRMILDGSGVPLPRRATAMLEKERAERGSPQI